MIDQIVLDLPILALFMKFMIASTLLLGGVWILEKIGVINSPDMSESAWKLAIFASFVALLPVSFTSNNLTIPINETVASEYVSQPEPRETTQITQITPRPAPQPEPVNDRRPTLRSNTSAELVSPEVQERIDEVREQFQRQASTNDTPPVPASQFTADPMQDRSSFAPGPDSLLIAAWASLAMIALIALVASYSRAIKSLGDRTRVPAEHHANRTLRALRTGRYSPCAISQPVECDQQPCLLASARDLPAGLAFEDMDEKHSTA